MLVERKDVPLLFFHKTVVIKNTLCFDLLSAPKKGRDNFGDPLQKRVKYFLISRTLIILNTVLPENISQNIKH